MANKANLYTMFLVLGLTLLVYNDKAKADFMESWESSSVGSYTPYAVIGGNMGSWELDDTYSSFPECGPTPQRGEIVLDNGNKMLKLISNNGGTECADNVYVTIAPLWIPITAITGISFDEAGELINPSKGYPTCLTPPCGDTVSLWIEDNHGNALAYVFQRAHNAVPNERYTMYREVFLDPDAGIHDRNLFDDFSTIPDFNPQNARVTFMNFEVSQDGWAIIDNIHIREVALPIKPTNPSPINGAVNQSITVGLSWSNGGGATSYDVYFGIDPTPDGGEYKGNQSGASYDPGILAYSTTYYWRINAVSSGGTTTGDLWSFTTEVAPLEVPDVVGLSQSSAESAITSAGLVVGTETFAYSHTVPAERIIEQNPAAGTSVALGSSVNLVISTGPTIYVDGASGSDSGGTGAQSSPYKTVAKALEVASNGDKIIIVAGSYPENLTINKAVTIEARSGLVRIGQRVPDGMVWVHIDDPGGETGHEGFNGEMSKYETTNAQYCEFLNAALASGDITVDGSYVEGANGSNGGADFAGERYYYLAGSGRTTNGAGNGGAARINYTGSSFSVDSGFENHPVTYVSWYGSTAFCNYYGWRLPTEWEWQAVADYNGSYTYGCGPSLNNSIANYRDSTHPDGTTVAGSFGAYGYGMCDMAGNVWEWTSSLRSQSSSSRVLHGGGWDFYDFGCEVAYRFGDSPRTTLSGYGFRASR